MPIAQFKSPQNLSFMWIWPSGLSKLLISATVLVSYGQKISSKSLSRVMKIKLWFFLFVAIIEKRRKNQLNAQGWWKVYICLSGLEFRLPKVLWLYYIGGFYLNNVQCSMISNEDAWIKSWMDVVNLFFLKQHASLVNFCFFLLLARGIKWTVKKKVLNSSSKRVPHGIVLYV